jgi:4-aminobutyrate aminotransferase-like enzyme
MHFQDAQLGYRVAAGLFHRGVLVAGTLTSAQTIRIEPPLVISVSNRLATPCWIDQKLRWKK